MAGHTSDTVPIGGGALDTAVQAARGQLPCEQGARRMAAFAIAGGLNAFLIAEQLDVGDIGGIIRGVAVYRLLPLSGDVCVAKRAFLTARMAGLRTF